MWYRKSVLPGTGAGLAELTIDEKNAKKSSSPCMYASLHVPDLVSPRTEFCDEVHMVQEDIIGYALRKHYSSQQFI